MNRKVAAGAALAAVAIGVAALVGLAGPATGQAPTTTTPTTPTTGQEIGVLDGPTELQKYKVGDTPPRSLASKLFPRPTG